MADFKSPSLRGRVALVTGASSGIGAAIARGLHQEGARVVAWGRRRARLEALAESDPSNPAEPDSLNAMVIDLRDESAIRSGFQEIRSRLGGVDILVNAAGLGYAGNLETGRFEEWKEILEVNVLALALATQEAVRDMRARGDDGHVVHISSMSGHRVPDFNGGMYSASKFAVRALAEAQRKELRAANSRIRVTLLSPGFVETEFHATYLGDVEKARALYASIESLKPQDVAQMVLYALKAPPHVSIHDVLMRSTSQVS